MTKMMKLSIVLAATVAVISMLTGDWLVAAWAITAGLWMWEYTQADRRADAAIEELRTERTNRPGEYLVPVRPGIYQRALEAINNTPPPPTPDHYSVGGTTPHLCVCGKPIKEHR